MDNIKLAIKQEVRWDVKGIEISNQKEIQESLEEGYEPFSVTTVMKKSNPNNVLAMNNNQVSPQMSVENVMWLKRGLIFEVPVEQ